jgi:hypothetical protein
MVDVMTALATVSQAIKLTQDLRGIDKAIDAAEYKLKIADLTNALSDIRIALTDAKDELASKDAELARLTKQLARIAQTAEVGGFKYRKGPDDKPRGRAFCPVCEQKTGYLFHLAEVMHTQQCQNCKGHFPNARVFDE